jgi:hypothetical protein
MNLDGERNPGAPYSGKELSKADSRRDALKKLAVYSAYATPALLALTHSTRAHAETSIIESQAGNRFGGETHDEYGR